MKILPVVLVILIIIILLGGSHRIIYVSSKSVIGLGDTRETYLAIGLAILSTSFVIMTFIINIVYSKITSLLYAASAIWLGTVYRLFIASVFILLSIGLTLLLGYSTGWITIPGRILLIIAVSISIYGVYHGGQTYITRYSVAIKNLPDHWINKKIAFVADVHLGAVRNIGLVHKITPMIEAEGVQALMIAGDYYDGHKANDHQLAQALGQIKTTFGTYFSPGNHEEYGHLNDYMNHLRNAGINVLDNQLTMIEGLQIIGVNHNSTTTSIGLAQVLHSLDLQSSQANILIKHIPSHVDIINEFDIDLQLSGHTHQGQVRPGPRLVRRVYGVYAYGMQIIGQSKVITTSGVGTRGPPQRVGTKSEIVIITLLKK